MTKALAPAAVTPHPEPLYDGVVDDTVAPLWWRQLLHQLVDNPLGHLRLRFRVRTMSALVVRTDGTGMRLFVRGFKHISLNLSTLSLRDIKNLCPHKGLQTRAETDF